MKKFIILFTLFAAFYPDAGAQLWSLRRAELTFGIGTTHFFGDIGGFSPDENVLGLRDISIHNIGLNINTSFRYRVTFDFAVRANLTAGFFHVSDQGGEYESRQFQATTNFIEPALMAEFYFIKNKMENRYLFVRAKRTSHYPLIHYLDLYLFGGIGALSYDVHPNLPLAYKIYGTGNMAPVIPAGIGISRNSPGVSKVGLELGGRYVLADKPDGYGAPNSNRDIYYFLNLTWTRKFKTTKAVTF